MAKIIRGGVSTFLPQVKDGAGTQTFSEGGAGAAAGGYLEGAGTTRIEADGKGMLAFGHAETGASGAKASIYGDADGAWAGGYAYQAATPGFYGVNLFSNGIGSFVTGAIRDTGSGGSNIYLGTIGGGRGAMVAGYVRATGTGVGNYVSIVAGGRGAIAHGYLNNSGFTNNYGEIRVAGLGALAGGSVRANAAFQYGKILASGEGALSHGYSKWGTISASGKGAVALGFTDAGANIYATGDGAVQIGPGMNAVANSLRIGSGIHVHPSAPGAPANGDIWQAGGYVYIRSNGISVKI